MSLRCSALLVLCLTICAALVAGQFSSSQPCFCKGPEGEAVEDCTCDGATSIDDFNNRRVFPLLQRLLQKDFFRFYKVNMEKTCPFWADERQCGSKMCGIQHCDDEVPAALRRPTVVSVVRLNRESHPEILTINRTVEKSIHRMQVRPSSAEVKDSEKPICEESASNQFDPLDASLSDENLAQLQQMDEEDNMNRFCDYDDEDSDDSHYVDLTKNPERYTGYVGKSAWKVWKSIYDENCFKPNPKFDKEFLLHPNTVGLCLEKRVFFRLISGMHSAISVSIASHCYKPAPAGFGTGTWFRNNEMFKNRFGNGTEGPERLKNVYFVYLLELRALLKAAPYLQKELFLTGNEEEDKETRQLVEDLMEVIKSYPQQFDETEMFTGVESHARELREEFRQHFMNISRIMDCVECDKCRLWGKLQTHGMGTALKILFSDLPSSLFKTGDNSLMSPFQLTRNEVVALFQSFGRYASSILEVGHFRSELMGSSSKRRTEL